MTGAKDQAGAERTQVGGTAATDEGDGPIMHAPPTVTMTTAHYGTPAHVRLMQGGSSGGGALWHGADWARVLALAAGRGWQPGGALPLDVQRYVTLPDGSTALQGAGALGHFEGPRGEGLTSYAATPCRVDAADAAALADALAGADDHAAAFVASLARAGAFDVM